jgi:hypothetical protein
VCDANLPTRLVLDCVLEALPLLAAGAAIVVTLKNFDGSEWPRLCDEAEARLRAACGISREGDGGGAGSRGDSLVRLHLFCNGPREVTLIGTSYN